MIDLFLPSTAEAAVPPIPPTVLTFIGKISTEILDPIIAVLFALATVYFFYGVGRYLWNPDSEQERSAGRSVMVWGIIGMFIMISVFGIMKILINTIGADPTLMNYV